MSEYLVITQLYEPEPNFITADVAKLLERKGSVCVITAHPNYPGGRFYPHVKSILPRMTVENGVKVWRLPMFPDNSTSILRRGLNYLSFLLAATLFAPFVAGRPRLIWVYNTPTTSYFAALFFRYAYRARIVLTCADLWPESFLAAGVARPGLAVRITLWLRRWANRHADAVICSTRTILDAFRAEGAPADRLVHIPVWIPSIADGAPARDVAGNGGPPRVVYAGNIGVSQWLDPFIESAARLHHAGVDIRLDLYGDGTERERLTRLARELDAPNVIFHGRVAPEVAFAESAAAHAQIVSLKPSEMFRMTVPSKLTASFAAGAPLLYCLEGEAAKIADDSGAAFAVSSDDPRGLDERMKQLATASVETRKAQRDSLRRYYDAHFARKLLLAEYEKVFQGT